MICRHTMILVDHRRCQYSQMSTPLPVDKVCYQASLCTHSGRRDMVWRSSHKFEQNQNKKQTTNNQFSKMPAKANKKKPGLLVVATPSADTIATTESVLEISPGGIVTPNKDSQCSDSVLVWMVLQTWTIHSLYLHHLPNSSSVRVWLLLLLRKAQDF
jgi:hypothetical protein